MEKNFHEWLKITKFVKVFSLESFLLYSTISVHNVHYIAVSSISVNYDHTISCRFPCNGASRDTPPSHPRKADHLWRSKRQHWYDNCMLRNLYYGSRVSFKVFVKRGPSGGQIQQLQSWGGGGGSIIIIILQVFFHP